MAPPFTLRAYQTRILSEIASRDSIVVLPTGSGKTAIAAEAIRSHFLAATNSGTAKKYLFLVPTRMLVSQQAAAIREWCSSTNDPLTSLPTEVAEYHGEMALPRPSFRVLVATPKAFQIAEANHPHLLGWEHFGHVTFDEVHHVLKDHPYRKIALRLLPPDGRERFAVRILGLTASLSYAVHDDDILKAVRKLAHELRIEHIATANDEELSAGGYHGNRAKAEVLTELKELPDSAVTRNSRSGEVVDVLADFSHFAPKLRVGNEPVLEKDRKPHLMAPMFWARVESGRCTPFTSALAAAVGCAEGYIEDTAFASPIAPGAKTRGKMSAWGEYAAKRQVQAPAGLKVAYWALEQWYEAMRILASSWEENEEGAVMFLKMMFTASKSADARYYYHEQPPVSMQAKGVPGLRHLELDFLKQYDVPTIYTHFNRLKHALLNKLQEHGHAFRGILFVQQRVTVHILAHYLRQDPETAEAFKCVELYSTSSPATPSLVITKRAAADALAAFAAGKANLLVTTVVAEEGMDIPAANCVFRFDPILNAVSYLQGRGRARQSDSSFVVMRERADRPADLLHEVESKQLAIAAQFVAQPRETENAIAEAAQHSRERGARLVLSKFFQDATTDNKSSVGTLNLYVSKTKADLEVVFKTTSMGSFECQSTYRSCLRTVAGRGVAGKKEDAKRMAAYDLLERLYISDVAGA